ncbi:uncharacterized protein N7446_011134 [Penicillium canescens]|uniref:F-box domain-containing protein n=1 Tax=Penicillium canescens TaxID=5083 RepID=A0AAD6IH97_PENCN|nr:uncharacterized protein N7446_011134 [Penicillium canescens]KAJ6047949.1 hypothetical protein N7460_004096 [Penicillium canescens]KAJ6048451.1 hypothetical protein N7446_011134 [Penicillium canescens]
MALMQLPTELLQQIIPHTLPEGFEGLVLTCKYLYELCTPFLEHYNNLRFHFQKFEYSKTNKDFREFRYHHDLLRFPDTATSAYSLISRIAIEAAVGHYILEADVSLDSHIYSRLPPTIRQNAGSEAWRDRNESVRQLFAESLYLREAGLDWKEFYSAMMEDVNSWRQSEHAAAFALTLLPNLQVLTAAFSGFRSSAPKKLITAVLQTARQNPHGNVSLAQVTAYSGSCDIPWVPSLLALPRIKRFWGHGYIGKAEDDNCIESRYLGTGLDSRLEVAGFDDMSVDAVAIAGFLKHTPRLKSLTYWHSTKANGGHQDWDLCKFIAAVQYEVGNHLEHLCAITLELRCLITPGKPYLRGFQRLESLELPLDIVLCNLEAAHPADHRSLDSNSLLGNIIPASVSVLSLLSPGKSPHDKALELLFRDFANQKQFQTPNLKEISLTCPNDADDLYKVQCANLAAEAKRAGTDLTISEDLCLISTVGLGEEKRSPFYS